MLEQIFFAQALDFDGEITHEENYKLGKQKAEIGKAEGKNVVMALPEDKFPLPVFSIFDFTIFYFFFYFPGF